jgi:hypothetical protein
VREVSNRILPLLNATTRPDGDLATVVLRLAEDLRDLVKRDLDDVAEEKHRALDRLRRSSMTRSAMERASAVRLPGDVRRGVGQGRLREPGADAALAADARRSDVVDREAGGDGREPRLRGLDLRAFGDLAMEPQERLLEGVLGLADRPPSARGSARPRVPRFLYLTQRNPSLSVLRQAGACAAAGASRDHRARDR